MTSHTHHDGWRETLLFCLLMIFVAGFYWCPSTRKLGALPHDLIFYLGLLPAYLLLKPKDLWNGVRAKEPGSGLLGISLVFVAYLGISSLWTHGDAELSLASIGLHTIATAIFIIGSSQLLSQDRWRQLGVLIVVAATSIAVVSVIAYGLGRHIHQGRMGSAIHYEHPNLFAHYLGFAALICLLRILDIRRRRHEAILPWAIATIVLSSAIVITSGRTAMLAFILAATLALILGRDRQVSGLFALGLMAVSVTGLTFVKDWAFSLLKRGVAGRDFIYQTLLDRVAEHPWTGLGLAATDNVQFPVGSGDFPMGFTMPHSHSAFLATYYHGGFFGLSLLLVVISWAGNRAFRIARKHRDPTGVVLLLFGIVCLLPDGNRLVSNPHLSSWLILWLPIAWIIAASRKYENKTELTRTSYQVSSRGREGAVASSVFDLRDAESYSTVRRAPRWEKTPLGAAHRRPQQEASEKCGLTFPKQKALSFTWNRTSSTLFWILVVIICAQRLLHFGADIETPQMWRQCDTAQYIRAFYNDGIDVFHPSVCWLADHKTTILEFALPEAVAAVTYHIFGPQHWVARMVFFLFFLGSAFFLHRFVREIVDGSLARMTVLLYLVMPLSLYYSRAIHIDFSAMFFVHAMAYYYARGVRQESQRLMWTGSVFACFAMMIKAPYVIPMILPLAVLVIRGRKWRFLLRSMPALFAPALVFGLWEMHVYRVNSQAPDWFFIPHYRKMVQNGGWYFGSMAQRLDLENWLRMGERFWREILGTLGVVPAIIGGMVMIRRRYDVLLAWCLGAVLMLMIFFNLCRLHNYYLIPFLAPLACLISIGILWLAESLSWRRLRPRGPAGKSSFCENREELRAVLPEDRRRSSSTSRTYGSADRASFAICSQDGVSRRASWVLAAGLLLLLTGEHLIYAENHYYDVLEGVIEAGQKIEEHTTESPLMIVSIGNFDCRSPHLLYLSNRYGWSIAAQDLHPELLQKLKNLGADHLAIVSIDRPQDELATWLSTFEEKAIELKSTTAKLYLYDLRQPPLSRSLRLVPAHRDRQDLKPHIVKGRMHRLGTGNRE